jgi:hypothetical protein
MLRTKPDSLDIMLSLILHDPILFGEFMRNTADGNKDSALWPKRTFKYRHYQKDLLTDTNEYISLVGGRAIGKCATGRQKLLTINGYQTHVSLLGKQFIVWSFDEQKNLVKRRAACFFNGHRCVIEIKTQTGYTIEVTEEHPLCTLEGMKPASLITEQDRIAVLTKTPHIATEYEYKAEEMRMLGYMLFQDMKGAVYYRDTVYRFRSESVRRDVARCCKVMGIQYQYLADEQGFKLYKKHYKESPHVSFHPMTHLIATFGLNYIRHSGWFVEHEDISLHPRIMTLGENNVRSFLEGLFAQYADISTKSFRFTAPNGVFAKEIQELLLRYGIETRIEHTERTIQKTPRRFWNVDVVSLDYRAVYRLLTTFTLPGYRIGKLPSPARTFDHGEHYRFDPVVSIVRGKAKRTFAVQVEQEQTYIVENMMTHNSFVLEDKMIFNVVNDTAQLPETPEIILTTANQNQLTPLLDRLTKRFYGSTFLRHFVSSAGLNRNRGTFDFVSGKREVRLYTRLAGARESANVVGLHAAKAIVDESQLYPLGTFNQLQKSINTWEEKTQIFTAGVPAGIRNTTLYYMDQKLKRSKKYRIPSPANPFFTFADLEQSKKDYGGEESDLFLNLVLGQHGRGAEVVLSRDNMTVEAFDFHNYAYRNRNRINGYEYRDKLLLPNIKGYDYFYAGIDVGFTDPTIIQCFGYKQGRWFLVARYLLQRIEIPIQEEIVDYLNAHYQFKDIRMDVGNVGSSMFQSLKLRFGTTFRDNLHAVMFNEKIMLGVNEKGVSITQDSKSLGADEIVRRVSQGDIVLSELDSEAVNQLERIAKQRTITGNSTYYILGEAGKGVSANDHIFASFICFAHGIRVHTFQKRKTKKLGKAQT